MDREMNSDFYGFGWLEAGTVSMILSDLWGLATKEWHFLVTCMDSNDEPITSVEYAFSDMIYLDRADRFVWFSLDMLNSVLDHEPSFFVHFDEIYLFRERPGGLTSSSDHSGLTSEAPIVEYRPDDIETIVEWMRSNKSLVGFGDGIGLNYITMDPHLYNIIGEYCSEDPEYQHLSRTSID